MPDHTEVTRWRRFIADDWLSKGVGFVVGVAWLTFAVFQWRLFSEIFDDWRYVLFALVAFVASVLATFLAAVILLGFLVAPVNIRQGRRNGAPFRIGDDVQVLAKPARGRITRVYSEWQGNSVRVDLGAELA